MLHFAYGANMDRAIMRRHAREAVPLGIAALARHRFVITVDGYASVERAPAASVFGVLWRLTPRDRVTLDVWEDVAGAKYRPATLAVRHDGALRPALVYLGRSGGTGRPRPGYMELVLAAALAWRLPQAHVDRLQAWASVNGRPRRSTRSALG